MAAADAEPPQRAQDGVAHAESVVRQECERQKNLQRGHSDVVAQHHQMAAQQNAGAPRPQGEKHRNDRRQGAGGENEERRPQRRGLRQEPGQRERQQDRGRSERAAEIVEHFPAPGQRRRGRRAPAPREPAEQLPVAPRPAVLAPRRDVVTGRKLLHHLHVGGEAGAGEDALEQIVAEHCVVGDAAGERGLKRVDVVNPFARVGAFAENILIDVGHSRRVGVHAAGAGEDPLVERALAPDRQRGRDARLENGVAADDALLPGAEPRPVERMGHLADQLQRGASGQPRVSVERDHKAHLRGNAGRPSGDRRECRVGRAAQQAVELVQLASFALPAHPFVLTRVEDTAPVEEKKALAGRTRPVPAVQFVHCGGRRRQHPGLAGDSFCVGIRPVGEHGEGNITVRAGEMVDLEGLDLLQQAGFAGRDDGHDDKRAHRLRHAAGQSEAGQGFCAENRGDGAVDQRRRELRRRQKAGEPEQRQPPRADIAAVHRPERAGDQKRGEAQDRARIADDAGAGEETDGRGPGRRAEADAALKDRAPVRDQIKPGVAETFRLACACLRRGAPRRLQRPLRDLSLRQRAAARQVLDRAAVAVARPEIHRREGAGRAQPRVDKADALEEIGPVDVGDEPHAGDDIAHGDIGHALAVMRLAHRLVDGHALGRQPLVQPAERGRGARVLVAQAFGELRGKAV